MDNLFRYYLKDVQGVERLIEGIRSWETLDNTLKRDKKDHQIKVEFTIDVEFVQDARDIIQAHLNSDSGINSTVAIRIEQRDDIGDYSTYFEGFLDLHKHEIDSEAITCPVIDDRDIVRINSGSKTKRKLDIEPDITLTHDGIPLFNFVKDRVSEVLYEGNSLTALQSVTLSLPTNAEESDLSEGVDPQYFRNSRVINGDLHNFFVSLFEQVINLKLTGITANSYFQANLDSLPYQNRGALIKPMSISFIVGTASSQTGTSFPGDFVNFREVYRQKIELPTMTFESSQFDGDLTISLNVSRLFDDIDIDIPMAVGQILYIAIVFDKIEEYQNLTINTRRLTNRFSNTGYLELLFSAKAETTITKGWTPGLLMQRILNDITGKEYTLSGDLDGYNISETFSKFGIFRVDSRYIITTGDRIRGIDNNNITISLDWLKQWYFTNLRLTPRIEGTAVTFVDVETLFQDVEIVDLGEVKEVRERVSSDYLFTTVRLGSGSNDYGELNGRDEYNNETMYEVRDSNGDQLTFEGSQLDLANTIKNDIFGIEQIRLKNFAEKQDNKEDKQLYFIKAIEATRTTESQVRTEITIDRRTYEIEENVRSSGIKGGIDASLRGLAYNFQHTPTQLMALHARWINTMRAIVPNSTISFTSSDKNETITFNDGRTIAKPLLSGDRNKPALFKPIELEIDTNQIKNILTTINNSNKYGYIRCEFRGKEYKGYIIEINEKPARNEEATYKLLAHV